MKFKKFEELQSEFSAELDKAVEKKNLIAIELEGINSYLNQTLSNDIFGPAILPQPFSIFKLEIYFIHLKLLKNAFYGYLVYNKFEIPVADYEDQLMIDLNKKVVKQGSELAKYCNWLNSLNVKPIIGNSGQSLNLEQKLLALHFLGLNLKDFNNTHSAKVLGKILNVGSENIRKDLSNLHGGKNKIRNITNFEKLLELFKNKTFDSILIKLKREIKSSN
jgi:hypothetical protein